MALHQEWNQMIQETCRNIVQFMSRRCQAVLQARGGHTHYWCSCHASVNILMKVTLGKIMICYETTLLPHLFSFKDFLLRSPLLRIETLFAFQNGHFLMFCFLCFIVKQIIHKSYVLVHFVMPEYCCCCHVNKFFWGRASSVSFYFPKSLVSSKLQICKTFAQVCILCLMSCVLIHPHHLEIIRTQLSRAKQYPWPVDWSTSSVLIPIHFALAISHWAPATWIDWPILTSIINVSIWSNGSDCVLDNPNAVLSICRGTI